ncbi:MAG: guanylate kinase [Clostridia bacterium]|nr:guanylate kinase [Clostridia bacterium]
MLVVLSGPSGSGKDTVLSEIFCKAPELKKSVSMTTRKPREGEIDGVDYIFVDESVFTDAVSDGKMLEYARYGGNYYGTPKERVDSWLSEGLTVILKIDVQGGENIRRLYPDAVSIFITPPSMSVLEKRLRRRGSEAEEEVRKRLAIALDELKSISDYDYMVINDSLEDAVDDVITIIKAEQLKVTRRKNYLSEVIENV